jgi:hypothetical protein
VLKARHEEEEQNIKKYKFSSYTPRQIKAESLDTIFYCMKTLRGILCAVKVVSTDLGPHLTFAHCEAGGITTHCMPDT